MPCLSFLSSIAIMWTSQESLINRHTLYYIIIVVCLFLVFFNRNQSVYPAQGSILFCCCCCEEERRTKQQTTINGTDDANVEATTTTPWCKCAPQLMMRKIMMNRDNRAKKVGRWCGEHVKYWMDTGMYIMTLLITVWTENSIALVPGGGS